MTENIVLKPASDNDCKDLWLWRNHPVVRKNFFNDKPISWKEHKAWFYSKAKSPNAKIYIATLDEKKIGVIRFETEETLIRVSFNLNPDFFNRNLGSKIMKLGTEKMLCEISCAKPIIAEIKKENIAAQKVVSRAGYKRIKETKEAFIYKKEIIES